MATAGTRHSQLVRWFIMAPFLPPESGPIAIYGLTTVFQVTGSGKIPLKVLMFFGVNLKTNLNVSGGWSKQGNHYPIPGKMCGR